MFYMLLFSLGMQLILGFVIAFFGIIRQTAETGHVDAYSINMPSIPAWALIVFAQVVLIGVPCLVYLIIHRKNIREILPLRRLGIVNIIMVTGMSITIFPAVMFLGAITTAIFGNPVQETMSDLANQGGIWLMLILIPILPSIFEEVALRGIVFAGYTKVKIFTAAIINGLFFGILHQNFNQFSYAFVIGFKMCYMMWYTKSLWAPVLSHFVINTLGSLLGYIGMNIDMDAMQAEAQYAASGIDLTATQELILGFVAIGSVALAFFGGFIAIYIFFKKHNIARNEKEGVITNTHAAAVSAGEPIPKALTWGFWATLALGIALMVSMQIL